jgi:hypothetical protein
MNHHDEKFIVICDALDQDHAERRDYIPHNVWDWERTNSQNHYLKDLVVTGASVNRPAHSTTPIAVVTPRSGDAQRILTLLKERDREGKYEFFMYDREDLRAFIGNDDQEVPAQSCTLDSLSMLELRTRLRDCDLLEEPMLYLQENTGKRKNRLHKDPFHPQRRSKGEKKRNRHNRY